MTSSIEKNNHSSQSTGFNKKVPGRISSILDHCIVGVPTFDLCCDQGMIGLFAISEGITQEVHFVDRLPHLIQSLKKSLTPHEEKSSEIRLHFQIQDILKMDFSYPEIPCNFIVAGVGFDLGIQAVSRIAKTCMKGSKIICQVNRSMDEVSKEVCALDLPIEHAMTSTSMSRNRKRTFKTHSFFKR